MGNEIFTKSQSLYKVFLNFSKILVEKKKSYLYHSIKLNLEMSFKLYVFK